MKVVIPAAGRGRRLRPHTWSRPKPLIRVAGRPVLGHSLDLLGDLPEIDEVVFIVGKFGDQIEAFVRQAFPSLRTRFVQQRQPLGQSHAIWLAGRDLEGPLIVTFADKIIQADLSVCDVYPGEALCWVKEVADPRPYGVAEVEAEGRVRRLVEKPPDDSNRLAVVGLYYFEQAADLIEALEEQMARGTALAGEFYLVDAINLMLAGGLSMRAEAASVSLDCGRPEPLLQTNAYLLDHGRDNSAAAAAGVEALVVPPVFIDPAAEIRRSVIGPYASIGAGCLIEDSSIRDSIIERATHIRDSTLAGCLVGQGARIQGRFRSLNLSDSSEVRVG